MSNAFVIRNQDGHYLAKKNDYWLDGSESQYLFKTPYQDVALNTLIEINSKQIDVRAEVLAVESDNKSHPIVEVSPIESKMPSKVSPATAKQAPTHEGVNTEAAHQAKNQQMNQQAG